MFIPDSLFNQIFKVLQTRKKHKRSVSNGCENLQPSTLHGLCYACIFFFFRIFLMGHEGCGETKN